MNDAEIEKEIQEKGLTAPRITPNHIASVIQSVSFFTAADAVAYNAGGPAVSPEPTLSLLTFCVLVLANGFTVTGESACASPENFDAEVGRKIAHKNAIDKVWLLEGYLLKQQLYTQQTA